MKPAGVNCKNHQASHQEQRWQQIDPRARSITRRTVLSALPATAIQVLCCAGLAVAQPAVVRIQTTFGAIAQS